MAPYEQLIVGMAAGLTFCALLRWTPLLRDLLAAIAAAGLMQFLLVNPAPHRFGAAALAGKLPREMLTHPHFAVGFAVAAGCALALLCVFRSR